MDYRITLLLILLVLTLLIWLFLLSPAARRAHADRRRRAAEERKRLEAEKARVRAEREEFIAAIRANAPRFIGAAGRKFEREYGDNGVQGTFGQEMSPLVCFGYRVGKTSGRTDDERNEILKYAVVADLDATLPFLPAHYRTDWGSPLSVTRFNRIHNHLINMADLRDGRRGLEVAVAQWRDDAAWLQTHVRGVVEKYHGI